MFIIQDNLLASTLHCYSEDPATLAVLFCLFWSVLVEDKIESSLHCVPMPRNVKHGWWHGFIKSFQRNVSMLTYWCVDTGWMNEWMNWWLYVAVPEASLNWIILIIHRLNSYNTNQPHLKYWNSDIMKEIIWFSLHGFQNKWVVLELWKNTLHCDI